MFSSSRQLHWLLPLPLPCHLSIQKFQRLYFFHVLSQHSKVLGRWFFEKKALDVQCGFSRQVDKKVDESFAKTFNHIIPIFQKKYIVWYLDVFFFQDVLKQPSRRKVKKQTRFTNNFPFVRTSSQNQVPRTHPLPSFPSFALSPSSQPRTLSIASQNLI